MKKNIFDIEEQQLIKELNQPNYRVSQIYDWIFKKGIINFKQMTNLPKELILLLDEKYQILDLSLKKHLISKDKSEKLLFRLEDNKFIETVIIPSDRRNTICISTQVGCKFGCKFCATGKMGFIRNLSVSEIINQIFYVKYILKKTITNYVFMGMGEPLDNFDNLKKAILIMNNKEKFNISARKITVSTAGVIPGLKKLFELNLQINIALSLHAPDNQTRTKIMPINNKYPVDKIIKLLKTNNKKIKRIITLEYILIENINDNLYHAKKLSEIANKLNAKINIIPYSPVPLSKFKTPDKKNLDNFKDYLLKNNSKVTVRNSKGKDINAACGQLIVNKDF